MIYIYIHESTSMTCKHQEKPTVQPSSIFAAPSLSIIGPSFGVSPEGKRKPHVIPVEKRLTRGDSETKEGQLRLEDQTAGRCATDGLLPGQWT